ncbi:dTMP kinase [Camelimonas abortus]|uniref:Thymidylate kinase n=1 Tax=Camelimonas abortus TaxID=1017184 RepID=A0ABV7LBP8_9HYPH
MTAMVPAGRFITFEGGEGVGKSTQIRLLGERLRRAGLAVRLTREPGGSPRAERIRDFLMAGRARALGPLAEAMLFSAARIDHVDTVIRPALRAGEWVLCDRFADSTRAYQGVNGGLDPQLLARLEEVTLDGLKPDLTVILDLPPLLGLQRAAARRGDGAPDRFESEDLAFHMRLRDAFLAIARAEPERCVLVDASGDAESVARTIFSALVARLGDAVVAAPAPAAGAAAHG